MQRTVSQENDRLVFLLARQPGFSELSNPDQVAAISAALGLQKNHQQFKELAAIVNCDPARICLISEKEATEFGEKINAVYFKSTFNRDFNGLLKEIGGSLDKGRAFFDRATKRWRLRWEGASKLLKTPEFREIFCCFIDADRLIVLIDEQTKALPSDEPAFEIMEVPVSVRVAAIVNALQVRRPQDKIKEAKCYIYNGRQFEQLGLFTDGQESFQTRLPFLALRYSLDHGKPRYALFDTVSAEISRVTFGNEDAATGELIAIYSKTVEDLKVSIAE